jgi:UDP-N-acetylmuramoylalanine-D-glutamate ligase
VRGRTPLGARRATAHRRPPQRGNALAATACALAAGRAARAHRRGLSAFEPVKGRSRAWRAAGHTLTLVDDSYNANPDSVIAAIDVLAGLPGPRLLVLGDMGEVGDQGPQFHAEVGAYARQRGIEAVYTLGETAHTVAAFGDAATAVISATTTHSRRRAGAPAAGRQRTGQGLALHEDGARGAGDRRSCSVTPQNNKRRPVMTHEPRDTPCC